jgi:hypothetical protein
MGRPGHLSTATGTFRGEASPWNLGDTSKKEEARDILPGARWITGHQAPACPSTLVDPQAGGKCRQVRNSVAQVPGPRLKVSGNYRSHNVKYEPGLHTALAGRCRDPDGNVIRFGSPIESDEGHAT